MKIPNGNEIKSIWAEFYWRQSSTSFVQCDARCKIKFHDIKNI